MDIKVDVLAITGLIFGLVFLLWLYRISRSDDNTYSLSDLITSDKHMDLSKIGQLVALVASTWVFIHMEMRAATVEWYAGLYMLAWVGARFGSLYAKLKGDSAASEIKQ